MNPAARINTACRAILAREEERAARKDGRNPDRRRSSTSAVARALGVAVAQWHALVKGTNSPKMASVQAWLDRWAQDHESIAVTLSPGQIVDVKRARRAPGASTCPG